jgi:hypothetical protein
VDHSGPATEAGSPFCHQPHAIVTRARDWAATAAARSRHAAISSAVPCVVDLSGPATEAGSPPRDRPHTIVTKARDWAAPRRDSSRAVWYHRHRHRRAPRDLCSMHRSRPGVASCASGRTERAYTLRGARRIVQSRMKKQMMMGSVCSLQLCSVFAQTCTSMGARDGSCSPTPEATAISVGTLGKAKRSNQEDYSSSH